MNTTGSSNEIADHTHPIGCHRPAPAQPTNTLNNANPLSRKRKFVEILYLLIPLSVVLVLLIAGLFWWTIQNGQLDDLEGPAHRIIMDDDKPQSEPEKEK